jgi:hypothetical protein
MSGSVRSSPLQVQRTDLGSGVAAIQIKIDPEAQSPPKQAFVDYVDIKTVADGVKILFGKMDSFAESSSLSYAVEISFPYASFVNQLHKRLIRPQQPGLPLFEESVRAAITKNGYPPIESLPPAKAADKQAHVRANAAALFIFDDDASIDFYHLDAASLTLATAGREIRDFNDAVRVVLAPNLLLYFMGLVSKAAEDLVKRVPELDRGEMNV